MDGLMDQITNHSSFEFETEAVGSPDRRPAWRVWRVAAAGVALAVIAAFGYLGFSHHREAPAGAPPAAPPLVTGRKPLPRAGDKNPRTPPLTPVPHSPPLPASP